jgi:hypothetical protein
LGEFLGLVSSRPDKEYSTGPDVLWTSSDGPTLCIEVKTGMEDDSCYPKKYIGQLLLHMQWIKDNTESTDICPCFVGPLNPICPKASAGREIVVIELDEFKNISEKLQAALQDICTQALPLTLRHEIYSIFNQRKLLWPELFSGLKKHILRDIQR